MRLSAREYDRLPEHLRRLFYKAPNPGSDEVMEAFVAYGERASGTFNGNRMSGKFGGVYGDFAGAQGERSYEGNSGSAARFFYSAKADKQDRWGSKHPTVKPVELIRYLVKLVCPRDGVFLDPFAGSGTAAVAALAEGRSAILIEQDPGYVSDIKERIAHYEGEGRHTLAVKNRNRQDKPGTLL